MAHEHGVGHAGAYLIAASAWHSQCPVLLAPSQDGAPAEAHALQVHGVHDSVSALCQVPQAQLQVPALTAKTKRKQAMSLLGEWSARPTWTNVSMLWPKKGRGYFLERN